MTLDKYTNLKKNLGDVFEKITKNKLTSLEKNKNKLTEILKKSIKESREIFILNLR